MTSQNLMDKFIDRCVFIHDDFPDGSDDDRVDHYGTNPFLIGADVCVVDTLQGFGKTYLQYLGDLDSLPQTIIQPEHKSNSLLKNLLADQAALAGLKAVMQPQKLDISSFHSNKKFEPLIDYLAGDDYSPRLIPPKSAYVAANNKRQMRILLSELDIPIPEGTICEDLADLRKFCRHCHTQILVKQDHRYTYPIDNDDDIDQIAHLLTFPVVVEVLHPITASPVSNYLAWNGEIQHLFTIDQVIRQKKHTGNRHPTLISPDQAARIIDYSLAVIKNIPGYLGVCGIDYIITTDGDVLVADVNARFNACTYPYHLLQRLAVPLEQKYFVYRIVNYAVPDLSYIFEDEAFVPFTQKSNKGMFLYNPVYSFDRKMVYRFSYLCVADSWEELDSVENNLLDIIKRQAQSAARQFQ